MGVQTQHGTVLASVHSSLNRWLEALGLAHSDSWSADQLVEMRGRSWSAASDMPYGAETFSVGGRCKMVRCRNGWSAIHLAREVDVDSVPAIVAESVSVVADVATANAAGPRLGAPSSVDLVSDDLIRLESAWKQLDHWASALVVDEVVARCALLDVPASPVPPPSPVCPRLGSVPVPSGAGGAIPLTKPATLGKLGDATLSGVRVVDTTALWAGPLAARLLGDLGALVVGNSSPNRPDPTQVNDPDLYRLLHRHHGPSLADPATESGRIALDDELARSDVVLFSARRRALERLGLSPGKLLARHPHLLVVTVTAYGYNGTRSERSGLGDDVAAGAGAVMYTFDTAPSDGAPSSEPVVEVSGGPMPHWQPFFVGDALADPVTGVVVAMEVASAVSDGRQGHLDVAMFDAMRSALPPSLARENETVAR